LWGIVGIGRVELPTSRLSGVRSNQLSYMPRRFDCVSELYFQVKTIFSFFWRILLKGTIYKDIKKK
jgi:hypothetical protein